MSALVIRILSVPAGSADAERAFSTFFHIRDKLRERLSAGNLEGRFFLFVYDLTQIDFFV